MPSNMLQPCSVSCGHHCCHRRATTNSVSHTHSHVCNPFPQFCHSHLPPIPASRFWGAVEQTPLKRTPLHKDTSLIEILDQVPTLYKYVITLWKEDASNTFYGLKGVHIKSVIYTITQAIKKWKLEARMKWEGSERNQGAWLALSTKKDKRKAKKKQFAFYKINAVIDRGVTFAC